MKCRDFAALLILICAVVTCVHSSQNETGQMTGRNSSTTEGVKHTEKPHEEGGICGSTHEEFDSSVHLARVEFERVETIFVVLVFIIVVVVAKMCWHHRMMHFVASNIPESVMLIIVGAHIGGIIIASFRLDDCSEGMDPPFRFTPDLFFLFLLPPIVLEAGYFIDSRAFFGNITTILVYAVIGTIWNALALGLTLYALSVNNLALTGSEFDGKHFSVFTAFLFGTICAAVDPVAVLAVFEDIHVNKLLHILVFGESLLNDAVTIVLFKVLGAFSNIPFDPSLNEDERRVTVEAAFLGVAQFFVVVLASLVIGVMVGMAASFLTRFSAHVHVLEPMIIFVMGYLSYILADMFEFSGIVSLIFCAMIMRHYTEANLSRKSSTTTKYALKVVSNVSEMIIFLFLGVSLYDTSVHKWDPGLSLWTIVFTALYRPIGVVVLTLIVNIFRDKKIGYKSVFVMSYSGLRGAVAFSLALTRINEENSLRDPMASDMIKTEFNVRRAMFTSVTLLVLFTVFVQGITIKPLVKLIKVRTAADRKPTMNEVIHTATVDHLLSGIEGVLGLFGHNRLSEKISLMDQKYLRKIFERYPEAGDEKILHTFTRLQQKESEKAVEKNLIIEFQGEGDIERAILHPAEEDEHGEMVTDSHLAEEALPSLNDILAASFAHPHEDHFGHVLASHDRESAEDHHFEPVNYRRDIIAAKHANRKVRRRRKGKLQTFMRGPSSMSFDSTKVDQPESSLPPLDETDDVPDIPFPVAEAELEIDSKVEEVSIPMVDMIRVNTEAPTSPGRYSTEPSDREFQDQDTTPLSPAVFVQKTKSKNTYV